MKTHVVSTIMSTPVQSVHRKTQVIEVLERMLDKEIRHVVVTDGDDRVIGVVSQRDIVKRGVPQTKVEKIMTRKPVTARPETPVGEAALILADKKIGCLPVVDADGCAVGVVSVVDLLGHLASTEGAGWR